MYILSQIKAILAFSIVMMNARLRSPTLFYYGEVYSTNTTAHSVNKDFK